MPIIPIRVVIHMDGGVVQDVITPDDPNMLIVILADYDWEELDGCNKPIGYYPVDPISEEMYKEYLNDVDKTVDELTGLMVEEKCQPTQMMTLS